MDVKNIILERAGYVRDADPTPGYFVGNSV